MTDKQIIKGCLEGNKYAQRMLYQKYKVPLFGVCMRYAKDRMEAEDFLQDGFIKIYKDLYQYKPTGALGAWMRRVMVNTALQHIRKRKMKFVDNELLQIADKYKTEDDILGQLRAKELVKMVQQLPSGYRAVFNLYVIEGYSHKEIAKELGITASTSKSQLSRAKAVLRKMIEKNTIDADYEKR